LFVVSQLTISNDFSPDDFSSPLLRSTKTGDGDSVDSSSEQSTGEITALIGPQGPSAAEIRNNANEMLARVDARIVQNSTHAHNVQNRVESPLNMDLETQRYQVQVEASRQALIKQQETSKASRFATPKKGRTPKHKSRFQAHRVSADHFTPLKDKKSGIQAPGSSSMTPHDRIVKSLRKENKETREHVRNDLAEFRDDFKENNEQQHKNTQIVINRNARNEHAKTRRENRVE